MPYVPSMKTDGKSNDRELIDAKVEVVATRIAARTESNFDLSEAYGTVFMDIGEYLENLYRGSIGVPSDDVGQLSETIFNVGKKYNYEGAFLGELNYAITRLIQRVPQIKVKLGLWEAKSEIRYWLYAITTETLFMVASHYKCSGIGIGGVFLDIKDEYKRRVNTAYEAAQIIKSGDCYDTPYYTRLMEVLDEEGSLIGYQEIMVERSKETLHLDVIATESVKALKLIKVGG